VARIEILPEVLEDFERIIAHLAQHNVEDVATRVAEITSAIDVLGRNPQIGRPAEGERRELVIGSGARGYVALYRYVPEIDAVFVLAVRGQKKGGFRRG
jgi:toxin ParE1/3/4